MHINNISSFIKKLSSSNNKFSFEEVTSVLNQLYELGRFDDYLKVMYAYHYTAILTIHPLKKVIDLFKKGLQITKLNIEDRSKQTIKFINYFGLACFYNEFYQEALNLYLLFLLRSSDKDRNIPLQNIGTALYCLNQFETAQIYFIKAIQELNKYKSTIDADRYLFLINLYKMNLCFNYIELGNLDKAKDTFNKVNTLASLPNKVIPMYHRLKTTLLIARSNSLKEIINDYELCKNMFKENNSTLNIIKLNKQMLKKFEVSDVEFSNEIIQENFVAAKAIGLVKSQKKSILKLIANVNNKEKKHEYLEEFFKIEQQNINDEIEGTLSKIFLNLYTEYFEELNLTNKTIKEQRDELKEITYILSHDLKTPLRTISSFAELINIEVKNKQYDSLSQNLNIIKNSCLNLYELVENLSELNALDKTERKEVVFDLNHLLSAIIENFSLLIKEKNAIIEVKNTLPKIKANSANFQIILQNLIENGLKFNHSKQPKITISCVKETNAFKILVADNGIGIEEANHKQIFSFFKKLHASSSYEGTGFGLGIIKKIVSSYEGTISLQSSLGKGTTFTLKFPGKMIVAQLN